MPCKTIYTGANLNLKQQGIARYLTSKINHLDLMKINHLLHYFLLPKPSKTVNLPIWDKTSDYYLIVTLAAYVTMTV